MDTISSAWSGGERVFFANLVTGDPKTIGSLHVLRSFGCFTEPLMYCIPLVTALYTELFLQKNSVNVLRVFVLTSALLSTMSTLGILIGIVGWVLFAYSHVSGKARLWVYTGTAAAVIAGVGLIILKYRNAIGSFDAHMKDYWYAIQAFLSKPWFGCGFDNDAAIRAFMPIDRLTSNAGLSNTISIVAAHGGILLLLLCLVPYLLLLLRGTSRRYRKLLGWGLGVLALFVVTIFYYHFYLLLVMAYGYAWLCNREKSYARTEDAASPNSTEKVWIPISVFLLCAANLWGLGQEKKYALFTIGVFGLFALGFCYFRFLTQRNKRQKVLYARMLCAFIVIEGIWMIVNNVLLTLHQLMNQNGLLMSQRLLGLPIFVVIYIVLMQVCQYVWECRADKRKLLATVGRIILSLLGTFVLLRMKAAWLQTAFQLLGWWDESLMMVIPVILAGLLYFSLYALEYSFLRRRIVRGARYRALATFVVCVTIWFGTGLYMTTVYDKERVEHEEFVQWNDELINEMAAVSEGIIFSNDLPQMYAEYHEGLSAVALSENQCRTKKNVTMLTKLDYASEYLGRYGYMVAQLSDIHMVYTNDEAVIDWLRTREYPVMQSPVIIQKLNMVMVALRNELEYDSRGVIVDGPLKSILHGPFIHLEKGDYEVQFDISVEGDLPEEDGSIAEIRISGHNGEKVIKTVAIDAGALSEEGDAKIDVCFSTDDMTGVEFILKGAEGRRICVRGIEYVNVPGYATVKGYDKSNRAVEERYVGLSGEYVRSAEGCYVKRTERDSEDRVIKEIYEGVDPAIWGENAATHVKTYRDGLYLEQITYNDKNEILSEARDSRFLHDLETYRKNSDYRIFLAVKDEASCGFGKEAKEALQELGLTELSELEIGGSYIGVICGDEVEYEAKGTWEEMITYEADGIQIVSAGFEAENIASIVIHGQEFSKKGRGINIVVYDCIKEEVVFSERYDTSWYYVLP